MKQQANQHHSERSFDVGDWVFLRLQPYKQMSLKQAKKDNKFITKVLWSVQGVPKDWYYGIQIGASCSFSIAPIFPCFMFKEGYRRQAPSSNNIAKTWRGRKNYIGIGN